MAGPNLHTASFTITLNQKALLQNYYASISKISVEDELNAPTAFNFTLTLINQLGNWQGINLDTFKPGDEISIAIGFQNLQTLVTGQITAIEPSFNSEYATVTIRGYDNLYRLHFGAFTKTYTNLSDSEIATEIAESVQLGIKADDTGITEPYILQLNESNYNFLLKRIKKINYEIFAQDSTLVFRKSQEGLAPVKILEYPKTLSNIDLSLKVPTKGSTVKVVSWNTQTKELVEAESTTPTTTEKMGGTKTGYQIAAQFPQSTIQIVNLEETDPATLEQIAKAQYQKLLNNFLQGNGQCMGDPQLRAGVNVRITGLSQTFNGIYYIISSSHTYSEQEGYNTSFQLRRTGA